MTANVRPLRSPEESRAWPLPIPPCEKRVRAALAAGFEDGERHGHVTGWRTGLGHGLLYGFALGAGCIAAAVKLGLLLGGA